MTPESPQTRLDRVESDANPQGRSDTADNRFWDVQRALNEAAISYIVATDRVGKNATHENYDRMYAAKAHLMRVGRDAMLFANLLVSADTARLVALGKAVEGMPERSHHGPITDVDLAEEFGWNDCLRAIKRRAASDV